MAAAMGVAHPFAIGSCRLETLTRAEQLEPLPVDRSVARAGALFGSPWATPAGKMRMNDSWIAAPALARGLPVVSQDAGYNDVPGLTVVRV